MVAVANTNEVYLTPEGLRKLKEELDYLRNVRRPEVARRIHEAKADGDVSENAGYDEAKNEQAFIEGRIMTLEALLQKAIVIQEAETKEEVRLGSLVSIRELGSNEVETYQIVGSAEVDPRNGKISNVSPLGKALMGRRIGERVTVQTPGGILHFEVVKIA
ncbi:MAG: transcription elongation factor GreA [Anaerolineae bacterium]|nr:transcription elongation factor GreA [Anaerolineae bacterium]MDW8099035.1 transcription elongation factor GreA [Anaerolineae bacterium]